MALLIEALIRYVNLKRSKLELERNLEQMRALEDKMKIHVGFTLLNLLALIQKKIYKKLKKLWKNNGKIKIAFQGEMGAYSHIACEELFPDLKLKLVQLLKKLLKLPMKIKL